MALTHTYTDHMWWVASVVHTAYLVLRREHQSIGIQCRKSNGTAATLQTLCKRTHGCLLQAMRSLIAAALADPLNARFAIISEASIPTRKPQLIWAQLMWEERSRSNACRIWIGRDYSINRWAVQFTRTSRHLITL